MFLENESELFECRVNVFFGGQGYNNLSGPPHRLPYFIFYLPYFRRIFFSCASQQQHSEFPAESNHKLRHTLPKYQFAIILKIKVAVNNKTQNFVSLRLWIKYSSCLHWIMLNHYKISDGFCLDTFYGRFIAYSN